ncbi:glycosyltransferase [Kocuria rosea]|uniref:glycosyltransferase n=1 Tax=Kocuria rosea TaxID=1275 RepID=UPI0025B7A334|nr:nucleotide disphospho-sugar-binding domain-containing protein [Kocuria rosea]WJZ68602.1 glycosyltransferase [Kocuria rosea]
MSRFLLASTPFAGHIQPMAGLARALVDHGHDVLFYTGTKYHSTVEDAGAQWAPFQRATDFDDTRPEASFPRMKPGNSPAAMVSSFEEIFFGTAPAQAQDLLAIHERTPIDALIAEGTCIGPSFVHEAIGIPYATFSLSPLGLPSKHLPPPGVPITPGASPAGRARDAGLRALMDHTVHALFRRLHNRARVRAGLSPTRRLGLQGTWSQHLVLAQGVDELEPPRSEGLPPHVHYIGDAAAGNRRTAEPPTWLDHLDPTRPVVHISEGTLGRDHHSLVARATEALAATNIQLVVGGHHTAGILPEGVIVEPWIPHDLLFPRTNLFISNGGYGAILAALSHDVPVLVVPGAQDKPLVARNIAASGAGITLSPRRATPDHLRRTMLHAIADRDLQKRATHIARRITASGGAQRAATLCEQILQQ